MKYLWMALAVIGIVLALALIGAATIRSRASMMEVRNHVQALKGSGVARWQLGVRYAQ